MALHAKTVTVIDGEQEPFEARLQKALSGLDVKHVSYSISVIADTSTTIRSTLIIHNV